MPTNNPSIHYLGVVGSTTIWGDHSGCVAQWERIKAERSSEYGPDGAYSFGACNSHGIRMVGRGWSRDSAANGVENGIEYNTGSRALCVLVGTDDVITAQCKEACRTFAVEAVEQHGMAWPLRPHSSFVATSCPGDNLRAVIVEINANHGASPAPAHNKEIDIVFQEKETGTYYAEGLGGFYGVEKAVGIGVGLNGGAVVPVTAAQMKKLGDDKQAQAVAFLKLAKSQGVI